MRFIKLISVSIISAALAACGGNSKPASPVETLKAYTIAIKKKDVTTMKLLLSEASLKIHQQEAKAQNVTLDDIVLRDTLFPPDQRIFDYRNEKVEGDKASVEVKNNFGGWDKFQLIKEDGIWKIDKKGTSEQMIQQVETSTESLDEKIRKDMEKAEQGAPDTNPADPTPTATPENPAGSNPPPVDPNAPPNAPAADDPAQKPKP